MQEHTVTLSFLGDISFNSQYTSNTTLLPKAFNKITPILNQSDYVVGNLECFCESTSGENVLKKPRLKTTLKSLSHLSDLKLNLVSLANNHVYDNLDEGFNKTCALLDQSNIHYLGASSKKEHAQVPFITTIKSKRFAFLNYVTHDTNPNIPDTANVYVNWYKTDTIITDINRVKSSVDHVILLLHWGGDVEGFNYPSVQQTIDAKRLISAGADAIIGHHSHTWQPHETINGKPVFYSLGNFCFDDVHFEDHIYHQTPFSSHIVQLTFNENKIYPALIPFKSTHLELKLRNKLTAKTSRACQYICMKVLHQFPFAYKIARHYWTPLKQFLFKRKDLSTIEKIRVLIRKVVIKFRGRLKKESGQ